MVINFVKGYKEGNYEYVYIDEQVEKIIKTSTSIIPFWNQGSLDSTGQSTNIVSNRVYTARQTSALGMQVIVPNTLQLYWFKYENTSNNAIANSGSWLNGTIELEGGYYYRFMARYPNDTTAISPSIAASQISFTFYTTNLILNKGIAPNETNLNSLKENAVYLLGQQSVASYSNSPLSSSDQGYLTVRQNGKTVFQVIEGFNGTRYTRYSTNNGSTWSNWI